jgi:molecular chaperone GrpE
LTLGSSNPIGKVMSTKKTEKDKASNISELKIPAESKPVEKDPKEVILELEKKALYLKAETENVRKRLQKEKFEHGKVLREALLNDIFPIYLSLNRALSHYDGTAENAKTVCDGIQLILKEFDSLFNTHGLKQITGINCPFDPEHHEALDTEERKDVKEKIILEEYEPGFRVHGQLVRPAKVKVGIPISTPKPTENGKDELSEKGEESCQK